MKNKKYFDGGSILSLLGGATNLIPKDNTAGGAVSGAINGASSLAATGNPYLMGAGALIGGVAGGIQGNKQNMQNQINPYSDGVNDRNNFLNIMADGGLIEYNTGGTHEQNPLGGIPQGVAPGGQTNTVEEGETRLKDFIFSDRLRVNKSMAKKFNIPDKFIGKSFADVSKTYNKELETRPNDPFSKKTVDLNMNNLMLANQEVADKKATNILADGGYLSPSQYSQQMQARDFNPAIPMMEPIVDQLPQQKLDLNTQLAGMPTTFLGTARKNWPIQDQNLLNTPNMPDRTSGINPQMVSEGQQARGYNQNVENYLRDVGRIVNQSQISGDTRSQDEITRDIVGDYDKQPLTTVPFPKTFDKGGQIQHKTNPFLEIKKDPYGRDSALSSILGERPQFKREVIYPKVNGMPPFDMPQPTGPTGKRWTIQDELQYATTPEDRLMAIQNFSRRAPSEWGYYAKQSGQEIGANGVPVQDIQGRFAGGVTPEHLQMLYPNIAKQVSPDGSLNWSDSQIDLFQKLYNEANYDNMMELDPNNPTYSAIGGDWLRGKDLEIPPPEIPGKTPDIPPPPTMTTTYGRINLPPTTKTTEKPGTSLKVPNLWPEAGLLSAAPYMGLRPELANPTLMSTGYLKPQLTDEMAMRSGIDSANRANIGALTGATGGNSAALRAGLLGAGSNYMDATSNAFMQGNQANNQARMAADQFNIQNQTGVAGNNMGALNQFELENKQLINNINAKKADEFANTMSDYVGNASTRRAVRELTDARAKDIFASTGYSQATPETRMQLTSDRTETTKIPGYSTGMPSSQINFNTEAALHPSSFIQQQNPYDIAGRDILSKELDGSRLNGINGYQQITPGMFDPFAINNTLANKKINRPTFEYGGVIKTRRRGLK